MAFIKRKKPKKLQSAKLNTAKIKAEKSKNNSAD